MFAVTLEVPPPMTNLFLAHQDVWHRRLLAFLSFSPTQFSISLLAAIVPLCYLFCLCPSSIFLLSKCFLNKHMYLPTHLTHALSWLRRTPALQPLSRSQDRQTQDTQALNHPKTGKWDRKAAKANMPVCTALPRVSCKQPRLIPIAWCPDAEVDDTSEPVHWV